MLVYTVTYGKWAFKGKINYPKYACTIKYTVKYNGKNTVKTANFDV